MLSAFNTLLHRLISLQIFQALTLLNVACNVAKFAHSPQRLKIPSFAQFALSGDSIVTFHKRNLLHLHLTTRFAWYEVQTERLDFCRTQAHLKQSTRPSKKATNINNVKWYHNVSSIAKDVLLFVLRMNPLSPMQLLWSWLLFHGVHLMVYK